MDLTINKKETSIGNLHVRLIFDLGKKIPEKNLL
jgi:hypothetical protein